MTALELARRLLEIILADQAQDDGKARAQAALEVALHRAAIDAEPLLGVRRKAPPDRAMCARAGAASAPRSAAIISLCSSGSDGMMGLELVGLAGLGLQHLE